MLAFSLNPSTAEYIAESETPKSQQVEPPPTILAAYRRIAGERTDRPVIGVHKRVDNPGTARMQLEQRMLQMGCYLQAVRKVARRYEEAGGVQRGKGGGS